MERQVVAAPPKPAAAEAKSNGSGPASPDAEPLWNLTTLDKLGPNLPVGILTEGKRSKLFRFRPYRLKEEKLLGELRENNKTPSMGHLVAEALSLMAQTVGPHNLDKMGLPEKRLLFAQMQMADVLYMYMYLRHEALGDEPIRFDIMCPSCRSRTPTFGDLRTLEVRQTDAANLRRQYKLKDGIVVGGELRHVLILEPMTWGGIQSNVFSASNPGARDASVIQSSVAAVEGIPVDPFMLADADMDELTKYDFEGLVANIEFHTPGPQMLIKTQCGNQHCKAEVTAPIDWGHDAFFKRSSRPSRGRA